MTSTLTYGPRAGQLRAAPRVLIVSGSVGAGHDGAARELAGRLGAAGADVVIRDFLTAIPRPVAGFLREGYMSTVSYVPFAFELLFRRLERRGVLWTIEKAVCRWAENSVRDWVADHRPDVVVSTYPLASQTIGDLRASGDLAVPAVTYLTDPAVHVSWLHPAVNAHLTVTEAANAQGAADYPTTDFAVGGPLVPARFAEPLGAAERAALARELGLPADRPVALLVSGSLGLGDVLGTVREVAAGEVTPLVLCGRNQALRQRLGDEHGVVALGWRDDVHRLMQVADVLVQNAGGLSFTEALVAGLPAVTYRPIPGHGRANARVLDAAGLAPWARTSAELHEHLHAAWLRPRTAPAFPDPARHILAILQAAPIARWAA
ncbi:MAG: UDP-N-acetylglucosamine:LPS N-acetylglucosamine transferase [Frankiales bacterium]|nr:UDP-N-acetylglucosamine:LPS N-acetylglucosamine transferase [Frankiales bacterium]